MASTSWSWSTGRGDTEQRLRKECCRSIKRCRSDSDCGCARGGASRRHHPSRSQARQRDADEIGREAARFRSCEDKCSGRGWQPLDAAHDAAESHRTGSDAGHVSVHGAGASRGSGGRPRTDIFAFGAMLYETVTGKHGVRGQEPGEFDRRHSERRATADLDLQPLSPLLLERIVAKCLAKEPDARWQSAADLRDELRWVALVSPPSTKAEVARAGGNRVAWTVAGVSLVIAALAVAAGLYSARAPGRPAALKCALKSACPGDSKTGWRFRPTDARSLQVDWPMGSGSSGCARSIP